MDMYGISTPDIFHIDDLLDFSNEDLFSSSTTNTPEFYHPPLETTTISTTQPSSAFTAPDVDPNHAFNFPNELCLPCEEAAELEWLSNFVDDSFSDFPNLTINVNFRPEVSVPAKARSKRSRGTAPTYLSWEISTKSHHNNNVHDQSSSSSSSSSRGRKCTHCASEKTPQWRTGPMGPKTLCNACGVRYKSGRLVPEYRPAASPTFTLTQHSNSHRKVMELRRQKEVLQKDDNRHEYMRHHRQQQHDFKVC